MTGKVDLDGLERLEKAATPGPWRWYMPDPKFRHIKYDEDQDLIVALRNAAPALIASARERDRLLTMVNGGVDLKSMFGIDSAMTMQSVAKKFMRESDAAKTEVASLRALLAQAEAALETVNKHAIDENSVWFVRDEVEGALEALRKAKEPTT